MCLYGWLAAGRCDVRRLGRDSGQETVLFGCRAPRGSLPSAPQNPTRLPVGARTTVLVYSVRLIYYYYYFSIFFFFFMVVKYQNINTMCTGTYTYLRIILYVIINRTVAFSRYLSPLPLRNVLYILLFFFIPSTT